MTDFREATVDLGAISRNVERLRQTAATPHFLAVVKANGYGHGAAEVARAAVAGGADWLGVADLDEAEDLRLAGVSAPILSWLHGTDANFERALELSITVAVSSIEQLDALARAAASVADRRGTSPVDFHIKLETGLSRNGVSEDLWREIFERAAAHERAGVLRVQGVFTHLSNTSEDDDREALARFQSGVGLARELGLHPPLIHAAASWAVLSLPESRLTMVRAGISVYGLSPIEGTSSEQLGLEPAMTLRSRVAAVRRVSPGTGVSYGYTWRAETETTLALVPLGYADGIPRQASNAASVLIGDTRYPVVGRIAMDQFVVDVGDADVAVGDEVVIFGDPQTGAPSADEWADAAGTINYDIVTRVGSRVARRYVVSGLE